MSQQIPLYQQINLQLEHCLKKQVYSVEITVKGHKMPLLVRGTRLCPFCKRLLTVDPAFARCNNAYCVYKDCKDGQAGFCLRCLGRNHGYNVAALCPERGLQQLTASGQVTLVADNFQTLMTP